MPATVVPFAKSTAPPVRGYLHRPDTQSECGLALTHGAGSDCNAPLLVALAECFAIAGYAVLRCDLPFRQKRTSGPPHASSDEDRAGLRHAVQALAQLLPGRVYLGGLSYGGRQASILAGKEPALVGGLLLLSYPLHAPGNPAKLRTEHFLNLRVPTLFIHGTQDPFGSVEEIQAALQLIPAKTELVAVEGGGHDLGYSKKGVRVPDLPSTILASFTQFFAL